MARSARVRRCPGNALRLACALFIVAGSPVLADIAAAEAALGAGQFTRVHAELEPLAEAGDARAFNLLGVMYQNGWGVPRDTKHAVALYRAAADLGLSRAIHNLARMLRSGLGAVQDDSEAARLWKVAGRQGFAPSQSALGFLYYVGDGVEKDVFRAYFWWSLAAHRFNLESTRAREDMIYLLSTHQKSIADQLVERFEPDR